MSGVFSKAAKVVGKSSLIRSQALIGGSWVNSRNGRTFPVRNPSDGSTLASVPDMGVEDTLLAIEEAHNARKSWASTVAKERSILLRKWFDLVTLNREELAHIITAEQGKPLNESLGEVAYGASFIEWFAEEAKRTYGDVIPTTSPTKRLLVTKEPLGVAALITPWNFPLAMITRKAGAALAAGCTTIVKPAEDTPLTALALAKLAADAGFAPGVYNTITCSRDQVESVGRLLATSDKVAKLSFTGSTAVGKTLMEWSGTSIKKVSLELGGLAPFIVFDSADLDAAVQGAIASKFRNSGQTCVCANRFYVEEGVYDAFCAKLRLAVKQLTVGDGFEKGVQQGPLINQRAVEKVKKHVEDALAKGARLECGGSSHSLGGTFFEPTLLTDCTNDTLSAREETFGPVASIIKFKTEDEAISLANDTPYGLAGYFYSRDVSQIWRVSEALECGMVGVNDGIISNEVAPFGGVKQSGLGREGSKYGIEEYQHMKYICFGNVS
eukprot:m.84362 g.84362  ORF g.84362 m.84362 type:complete len:497 (+) comp36407_c0_seq7:206-1696(+)